MYIIQFAVIHLSYTLVLRDTSHTYMIYKYAVIFFIIPTLSILSKVAHKIMITESISITKFVYIKDGNYMIFSFPHFRNLVLLLKEFFKDQSCSKSFYHKNLAYIQQKISIYI